MKTLHQTNCEIFDIVKSNELILYSDIRIIGVNNELILQSISKLSKDHGLISVKNQKLSLSEKGLKYKSFESYLESLKKDPISKYQKIHIGLTTISLIGVFIFGYLNYSLNQDKYDLKDENVQLKSDLVLYKDSLSVYKEKPLSKKPITANDTADTKYSYDQKTD